MRRGALVGAAFLFGLVALAASAAGVAGETTHVYSVSLTIQVDRQERKIKGSIEAPDAPSEFCDQASVSLREVMPGHDKKVNSVSPVYGRWGMRTTSRLSGKRVYAEVVKYKIPDRPVICLGAKSRIVTAP